MQGGVAPPLPPLAAARGAAADAAAAVAAAAVALAAAADAAAAVARRHRLHGKAPGVWEITITIEANQNVVVYNAPRSAGGFLDADDFINYVGPNDDCADDAARAAHPMDGVGAGNDWGGRIVADVNGNLMTIVNMPDGGTTFRACYLKPSPPASGRRLSEASGSEVIIGAWTAADFFVATEVSLSDTDPPDGDGQGTLTFSPPPALPAPSPPPFSYFVADRCPASDSLNRPGLCMTPDSSTIRYQDANAITADGAYGGDQASACAVATTTRRPKEPTATPTARVPECAASRTLATTERTTAFATRRLGQSRP